jgi:hypothetical protein
MNCCRNCFTHEWLITFISDNARERGDCDFCDATDLPVIGTDELTGYFRNLLSMYVVADSFESGETLPWLIQWRWGVFNEDRPSEMSCSPTSRSLDLVGIDPIQHLSLPEGWCSRTGDRLQMPANRLGASLADW